MDKVQSSVNKRWKGKDSDSSSSSSSSSSSGSKSSGSGGSRSNKDEVVVLDATNFDALVLKSKDIWMVEFYAPWCGHCKALEPEWKQAASNLKG